MDADAWRRMLLSKSFGNYSSDLANAIAQMARILCVENCSEGSGRNIECLVSCTLIPLDKNPGVRPIGIGEVLRRIIGKAVMHHLKNDVLSAAGNLQLCTGHLSGSEAAVHALREIFEENETEAVLLVDASNAFNSMNRQVMIHNTFILCPTIAVFTSNCYQQNIRLFIMGGKELKSNEGTTQGDPIAMAIYGINLTPLMSSLRAKDASKVKHLAFADDLSGGGKLSEIRSWWDHLKALGPKIGYFPNEGKSWLIVKEANLEVANEIFKGSSLNITIEGRKHMGAAIGSSEYRKIYANNLVENWVKQLSTLAGISKSYPQAAYIAFTAGFRHKFNYYLRTIKDISHMLQPVENVIRYQLIPNLCNGRQCTDEERKLFSLPVKMGGLGLVILTEIADDEFTSSTKVCKHLATKVKNQDEVLQPNSDVKSIITNVKHEKLTKHKEKLKEIRKNMNKVELKANDIAQLPGASIWLSTLPLKDERYMLNKQEFVDLIYLRYNWELQKVPINCACSAKFTLQHALNCNLGGYVISRHNHLRDLLGSLLNECCTDMQIEPPLLPAPQEAVDLPRSAIKADEARADISARGFWEKYRRAFFDVKVANLNAPTYTLKSVASTLTSLEKEKKRKYNKRIQMVDHGSFTPLIFGVNGGMSRETEIFVSKLADKISTKKSTTKSETVAWIRRKIQFSLIRDVSGSLRGERRARSRFDNNVDVNDIPLDNMSCVKSFFQD